MVRARLRINAKLNLIVVLAAALSEVHQVEVVLRIAACYASRRNPHLKLQVDGPCCRQNEAHHYMHSPPDHEAETSTCASLLCLVASVL